MQTAVIYNHLNDSAILSVDNKDRGNVSIVFTGDERANLMISSVSFAEVRPNLICLPGKSGDKNRALVKGIADRTGVNKVFLMACCKALMAIKKYRKRTLYGSTVIRMNICKHQ